MASRPVKLKLVPRSTIKAKSLTRLVGQLTGGDGITVTKDAGNYEVAIDLSGFNVVAGPVTATDNSVVRWNGTDGRTLQDSLVTIADDGELSAPALADVAEIDTTTRATIFEPWFYQFQLIDDDGATNQTASLQAQIDYCKAAGITHAKMPPYTVWAENITVDFPLMIEGAPAQIAKGNLALGLPGNYGSYLVMKTPGAFGIQFGSGCNGGGARNFGFWQVHTADASFVTPTNYGPCVWVYNTASVLIENITTYWVDKGFQLGSSTGPVGSGFITIRNCQGACFTTCIDTQFAGDFTTIENCTFHGSNLYNNTNMIAYIQANGTVLKFDHSDHPLVNGVKSYGYLRGVHIIGATIRAQIVNCNFDSCRIGMDLGASSYGSIDDCSIVGCTAVTTGFGMQIQGPWDVSNTWVVNSDTIGILALGAAAKVNLQNVHVDQPNRAGAGSAAISAQTNAVIEHDIVDITRHAGGPSFNTSGGGVIRQKGIRSSGTGKFSAFLDNVENLTADHTLTLGLNNGDRSFTLEGNLTKAGTHALIFTTAGATNLSLPTAGTVATTADVAASITAITSLPNLVTIQGFTFTLTGNLIRSGAHSLTLTTAGATNVTLPTAGTLATTADIAATEAATALTFANRVINPSGKFAEAGVASTTDATYTGFDQWLALTQTAAVTPSQLTAVENGTPYMMRMTQPQASAQRMGFIQWIEKENCIDLRGKTVTLSLRARLSTTSHLRMAIVEWTGTDDSITKDIVNDWTSSTYTTSNFFTSTSTTVSGVSGSLTGADSSTLATLSLTATIGSSANNIAVFVWSEGTVAQNGTLDIGKVQLEIGSAATVHVPRPYAIERNLCRRYWRKLLVIQGQAEGTTQMNIQILHEGMRVAPTLALSAAAQINGGGSNFTQSSANLTTVTSDADHGLYIFGNFSLLVAGMPYLWRQLTADPTADARL